MKIHPILTLDAVNTPYTNLNGVSSIVTSQCCRQLDFTERDIRRQMRLILRKCVGRLNVIRSLYFMSMYILSTAVSTSCKVEQLYPIQVFKRPTR